MVESSIGQCCFRDGNWMSEQELRPVSGFFALLSASVCVVGWMVAPQKIWLLLIHRTCEHEFTRKWAFADIVKLRIIRWVLLDYCVDPKSREKCPCSGRGQKVIWKWKWKLVVGDYEWRNAWSHQGLEEARKDPSLEAREGNLPTPQFWI